MPRLAMAGASAARAFGFLRTAIANAVDQYFNLTTLLLPGNGTNGAQNNTFLDSSSNNFTITRNGNTTQGTFSPFSQAGWGLQTGGRSLLSIPASSDFDLISTDFTIEFWFNVNAFNTMSGSGNNFFGNGLATATNGWYMSFDGSGTTTTSIIFGAWNGGTRTDNVFTGLTLNMGTWYHIALQRNGTGAGNLRLFVNGVMQGSALNSATYSTAGSTFTFGSGAYTQNGGFSGNADYYISNVRLTKSAVYSTSGFTPPTSNLSQLAGTTLLIGQSNRFVNNGTNTGVITNDGHSTARVAVVPFSPFAPTAAYDAAVVGGSGYFDGSGDYLSLSNAGLEPTGTSDFTYETWVYNNGFSGSQYGRGIITLFAPASYANNRLLIRLNAGFNLINFYLVVNGSILAGTSGTDGTRLLTQNAWSHLAVVRRNGVFTVYINGVQDINITNLTTVSLTGFTSLDIGRNQDGGTPDFSGYMSNTRYIRSQALTSGAFTPPTALVTSTAVGWTGANAASSITGTVALLCNFTNAGVVDSTGKNALETVGNAQISTTQSRFGGGSMYFDGTGDYAYAVSSAANSALGSGDWTVEFWLYTNAGSTTYNVIDWRPNATQGAYFSFYLNSGTPTYYTSSADRIVGGSAIPATTWTHVAVSRSGTSTRMFINGTQSGSTYTDTANYLGVVNRPAIGGGGSDTNNTLNGYIDDLRVTRGFARYTSNFTPPTAPFALQ